jgi:hypothetical protein
MAIFGVLSVEGLVPKKENVTTPIIKDEIIAARTRIALFLSRRFRALGVRCFFSFSKEQAFIFPYYSIPLKERHAREFRLILSDYSRCKSSVQFLERALQTSKNSIYTILIDK